MLNEILEEQKERNRPMPELFHGKDIRNSGGWDVDHAPATRGRTLHHRIWSCNACTV